MNHYRCEVCDTRWPKGTDLDLDCPMCALQAITTHLEIAVEALRTIENIGETRDVEVARKALANLQPASAQEKDE